MSHGETQPLSQYDQRDDDLHLLQLFDGTDEVGTGGEDLHRSGARPDAVDLNRVTVEPQVSLTLCATF